MGFLDAIEVEIAELELSLEADPRAVKLRELRRVRTLYTDESGAGMAASPAPPRIPMQVPAPRLFTVPMPRQDGATVGRRMAPDRVQALLMAKEFLTGKVNPTKTVEIFDHLQARGAAIGGNDPRNNLSAMLYHSPDFRSHGRAGWTLNINGAAQ
jgi:hypothetical protein